MFYKYRYCSCIYNADVFNNNDFSLYFKYKVCRFPTPIHRFHSSAVGISPIPLPSPTTRLLGMQVTHNVYYDSTHIHKVTYRDTRGGDWGSISKNLVLFPIYFIIKMWDKTLGYIKYSHLTNVIGKLTLHPVRSPWSYVKKET